MEEEIARLKVENERLQGHVDALVTELRASKRSGKAARTLIRELMKVRGPAAHVQLEANGEHGMTLTVCAPPDDNEERLAKRVFELIKGAFAAAGVDFDGAGPNHVGVTDS